jgi:hypothetical protein
MNIWLSFAIRFFYVSFVCFLAFWIGIAVAMGFDAGGSIFAYSIAAVYLFTFLPAILLGILPESTIFHPPSLLRIWYWWLVLLAGLFFLFQIIGNFSLMSALVRDIGKGSTSTNVCFVVSKTTPNEAVWIDLASPNIEFRKMGGVPLTSKQWCGNFDYSLSPMKIRAYSATNENLRRNHADAIDNPSNVISIDLQSSANICIEVIPADHAFPIHWAAQVVPCAR